MCLGMFAIATIAQMLFTIVWMNDHLNVNVISSYVWDFEVFMGTLAVQVSSKVLKFDATVSLFFSSCQAGPNRWSVCTCAFCFTGRFLSPNSEMPLTVVCLFCTKLRSFVTTQQGCVGKTFSCMISKCFVDLDTVILTASLICLIERRVIRFNTDDAHADLSPDFMWSKYGRSSIQHVNVIWWWYPALITTHDGCEGNSGEQLHKTGL